MASTGFLTSLAALPGNVRNARQQGLASLEWLLPERSLQLDWLSRHTGGSCRGPSPQTLSARRGRKARASRGIKETDALSLNDDLRAVHERLVPAVVRRQRKGLHADGSPPMVGELPRGSGDQGEGIDPSIGSGRILLTLARRGYLCSKSSDSTNPWAVLARRANAAGGGGPVRARGSGFVIPVACSIPC